MTEAEWLTCTDPQKLLAFLWKSYPRLSDRKLLLFTAGCCHALSPSFPELQDARSLFEGYAEGVASEELLRDALQKAWLASWDTFWDGDWTGYSVAATIQHICTLAITEPYRAACCAAWEAHNAASQGRSSAPGSVQCVWLRDLFHSPFRPVFVQRRWLLHDDSTVRKLAAGIYEERAFERLPILADALEDAGCSDLDVLAHCRSDAGHLRGCWALDAVLGKQ